MGKMNEVITLSTFFLITSCSSTKLVDEDLVESKRLIRDPQKHWENQERQRANIGTTIAELHGVCYSAPGISLAAISLFVTIIS